MTAIRSSTEGVTLSIYSGMRYFLKPGNLPDWLDSGGAGEIPGGAEK
jgi:hypothetical protein